VQQHVVEHAPQGIVGLGVGAATSTASEMAMAERARVVGVGGEDRPARLSQRAR